jgi:alpha-tubulin suppressor-like RCC1 family protein
VNKLVRLNVQGNPIVNVAAGSAHTVALSRRRRVYTWGHNRQGQLGLGHHDDGGIPVVVADSESWRIAQVSVTGIPAPELHMLSRMCNICVVQSAGVEIVLAPWSTT